MMSIDPAHLQGDLVFLDWESHVLCAVHNVWYFYTYTVAVCAHCCLVFTVCCYMYTVFNIIVLFGYFVLAEFGRC